MNRRSLTIFASTAAAAAALAVGIVPARAATSTGTVLVKATVAATCALNSPTLNFGAYDPTVGTDTDIPATLVVNCTKGTAWVVGLDQGVNGPTRNMKNTGPGTDTLHYELFVDTARTKVWTNGTTASPTVASGTGTGAAAGQNVTIFGRLFANQFVTPSTYQDSVIATVNF